MIFAISTAMLPGLDRRALELAVWFVGAQTVLSYATAGIAKAISPTWMGGEALAATHVSSVDDHRLLKTTFTVMLTSISCPLSSAGVNVH